MSIRLFRMYVKVPIVLLALIESLLLVYTPFLAAALHLDGRGLELAAPAGNLLPTALLFAVFGLLSLFAVGLYSVRQRSTFGGMFVRIVTAIGSASALLAVAYYLVPALAVGPGLLGIIAGIAVGILVSRKSRSSATGNGGWSAAADLGCGAGGEGLIHRVPVVGAGTRGCKRAVIHVPTLVVQHRETGCCWPSSGGKLRPAAAPSNG